MSDTEPRASAQGCSPERLVAGAGGRLRRCRSPWLRGGWLNTGGAQCAIDHHPKLRLGQGPGDPLSVDKHGGRALETEGLSLLGGGAHLLFILFGQACVQLPRIELGQNGLLARNAVESLETLFEVAVFAVYLIAVGVE